MKKMLLFLPVILVLVPISVWAQEVEKPLPTKLPTIIVKGKDRSSLEIVREKTLPSIQYEGEKELILSPIISPLGKRSYLALKKSSLPYLHFFTSVDENSGFAYRLNYGREEKGTAHFLNLGRTFYDQWVKYKEEINLGKEIDKGDVDIIWNSSKKRKMLVSLKGEKERIDLPNEEKREKTKIGIKGDWSLKGKSNTFSIKGLVEKATLNDPEENYDNNLLGVQMGLKMKKSPLTIGAGADWEDFTEKSETYLGAKGVVTLLSKKEKRLSLDIGGKVKWMEKKGGEFLPSLKAFYQTSPMLSFQIIGEKEAFLPRFADLYLPYDYIKINEDISPVRVWNYEINVKYSPSRETDFLLRGFHRKGEDVIWNGEDSGFTKPIIRDILLQGGEISILHRFSEAFEQEFVYTYQGIKNTEDKDKVIPYYPENSGALWFRWNQAGWRIEIGGEMIGKRWTNELDKENNEEKLSTCYKERLTIAKKIGRDVEGFIQWERNDFKLWKDYSFPHPLLSLGIEARLF